MSYTSNSNNFNEILSGYQDFYDHSYKHLSLKMREVSAIEQRTTLKSDNYDLVVYDERIQCTRNELKMNLEMLDLYFYNKKKNQVQKSEFRGY